MLHKQTIDQSTLELLIQIQQKEYMKGFYLVGGTALALKGSINQVKVDILAHRYPLLNDPLMIEGISMLSVEDIVAMKLNAISVSGQRVKDFIDIYYLLEAYTVEEMISLYKMKYQQYNEVNVLKSLSWFDDVDLGDWPVIIKNPELKWCDVKKKIKKATNTWLKQL